ncbi:DNA polymerase zeta [Ceratobasidium sp. 392]|nr:DNA polymerase zeta [Ceratobasidium sp. 392]
MEDTLKVRLTNIDWSLVRASTFDNTRFTRCPVVRVFGVTSTGAKACIHIHQVYPYFYVPYDGSMAPEDVGRYIRSLTQTLNRAIAISLKRNPFESKFVRAVILVKGVDFYGFHCSYSPFLKVIMADPGMVQRAATVLRSGAVMRQKIQTFETHISYILQFMCDFGLYGCGWLEFNRYYVREGDTETNPTAQRHMHHTLTIPAPAPSPDPLVQSVRELWDIERTRRSAMGLNPTPELPVDPNASQRGAGGQWEQEPLFWEQLRTRMARAKDDPNYERDKAELNSAQGWEKWVMTAFESVEALWHEDRKTWVPQLPGSVREGLSKDKPATQAAREVNPYGITQMDQHADDAELRETGGKEDSKLGEVDEDLAAGQAFQKLVTAAEEAEFHEDDESWDDLLYDEALRDMATQGTDREVSVPTTPIKRNRTGTPMSSPRQSDPFSTPESVRSRSQSYVSPSTTPTRKVTIKDSPSKFERLIEDFDKKPIKMPKLARPPSVSPVTFNPTPVARARKQADDKTPLLEEDNPFLDDTTIRSIKTEQPQPSDETELLRAPKRQKLTQDYQPTQRTQALPKAKVTRWADLEEQLIPPTLPQPQPQQPSARTLVYQYDRRPPIKQELLDSLASHGLPSKIYRAPFYSKRQDVPEQPMRYAGRVFHIKGGTGVGSLKDWKSDGDDEKSRRMLFCSEGVNGWEYAGAPPSTAAVKRWLDSVPSQDGAKKRPNPKRSQLEGPTQNTHGFKITQKKTEGGGGREKQTISALSVETFACTRGELLPNPSEDEIACLFYCFSDTGGDADDRAGYQSGCIVIPSAVDPRWVPGYKVEVVESELDLLNSLIDIVRDWDPDILAGWQVQTASWGYIEARSRSYGLDMSEEIARVSSNHGRKGGSERWDETHGASFHVIGRHVLNVWRIMRSEQALNQYTYENVVFHIMHKRVPRYSDKTLSQWFKSSNPSRIVRLLKYWADRTAMVLDVLDQTEVILRTAESARIIGVDFMSVLTRGSQFKVESIMFKIAKQENFILISPSKEQVGSQNACECLPLVMEPESAFYMPLVVLDFQSLYPSIMIAYNYCYSTFLGRAALFQGRNKFGVIDLDLPPGLLETIGEENIHIAANGMAYAKRNVREGLLGRMLTELLDTRIMAMKSAKGDRGLHKILNARQLSLKFICNVTYGYTSANFSGRMPAAEIADSIVQSGRETLEKAIAIIEQTPKWGARVVYGDTDSLFVYLPGRTKEQAFRLGNEIADTVTAANPPPIKLKFEKVYYPCVLMAKKRYVGFKYEHPDESEPVFDAKGIETVRRDGVPAGQKMVEKCLNQDFSEVKDYCVSSWTKILKGQVSIQDFIYAKEVRLGGYSDKVPPPPGATVAAKKLALDPMADPQYGDRVPYVIIRGEPGLRLVDRAVPPEELLNDRHKKIDDIYYITHALIPPLERVFNLVGTNVRQWFEDMPKPVRSDASRFNSVVSDEDSENDSDDRQNIDEHFKSMQCTVCRQPSDHDICEDCFDDRQYSAKLLLDKGSGNLRLAVVLPDGEDLNEWLAVHTVDFFNHLNMLYGTVTEFCTPQQCPIMSAGPRYEYLWEDGVTYKRPTKLSAPDYVDALMNWVQGLLDDEKVFPNKIGVPFPRNFQSTVKTIVRRLFRVYAHLYSHHFEQIAALGIEAHLNTSYRHFFLFINEFDLVDKKELVPLDELNEAILAEDKGR